MPGCFPQQKVTHLIKQTQEVCFYAQVIVFGSQVFCPAKDTWLYQLWDHTNYSPGSNHVFVPYKMLTSLSGLLPWAGVAYELGLQLFCPYLWGAKAQAELDRCSPPPAQPGALEAKPTLGVTGGRGEGGQQDVHGGWKLDTSHQFQLTEAHPEVAGMWELRFSPFPSVFSVAC